VRRSSTGSPRSASALSQTVSIDYRDTSHYLLTRDFLNSPERFFKHLFKAGPDAGTED
jgi:hypothetical protein